MKYFLTHAGTWIGILFCISQSALFSGLNLAYFSVTRLRLEVEASGGNRMAKTVLKKRKNYNYLLATILWGNVGINVLLTLLTDSVMTGVGAFFFSTVVITLVGEITPQAYFSRHALIFGHYLSPVITVYEYILYPVVKPVAIVLNYLLGDEAIHYYREPDLKEFIREHVEAHKSEIGRIEGMGALNFLTLDDLQIAGEGVPLDPKSILRAERENDRIRFPEFKKSTGDPLLQNIQASGKKWIVFVDEKDNPVFVLNANRFLRDALLKNEEVEIRHYGHKPIVVRDLERPVGSVMNELINARQKRTLDQDIILLWGANRRIITSSDILRRLFYGTKLFGL